METSKITEVLKVADTKVNAIYLTGDYQGVAVEVTNGIECEGTLLYFPGVTLKRLKGSDYK